jgi:2-hydroxychromene-2-carboxylate isomerase
MAALDYYFSTFSPYTHLAGTAPAELAARHGLAVRYKPLDILALFARTGGTPVAERHPSRQAYRLADLARQAKKRGMEINLRPLYYPANAAPSSYAIIAAQRDVANGGGGDLAALVAAITRACWAEEKNIADDAVIRACLVEAGFDPGLADKGLFTAADEYSRNLEEAVQAGVFGAPSWVTPEGQVFWGQDRLDDLEAHLAGRL